MKQHRNGFHIERGMRQGYETESPIPTKLVSNEEFQPQPQTLAQREVEQRVLAHADLLAPRLGLSRREFLRTGSGMATAFLAMNTVFGKYFNVSEAEAVEIEAARAATGDPYFIFDVQLHYVGDRFDPQNAEAQRKGAVSKGGLMGLRKRAQNFNPALKSDSGTLQDLSWQNFIKEVFFDSETAIGLISTPPGPYPQEAVVPPKEMTLIRDEINRVTQSQRMFSHGLVTPQLGKTDLDFMAMQAQELKIDAWKAYTGSCPKGFEHGWFLDDEKIAYPMLEQARKLGVKRFCVHKGIPLGTVADYNHPRDLIKAAKDFPDIDFMVYHSGFLNINSPKPNGEVPWTTEFCEMKKKEPGINNIYMELGSTFAQLVSTNPSACAHLLGQIINAFGDDHLLWGTDSIWYGTPQWQIEAMRRFQIPDELIEKHGYAPLTRAVKEKIFGLNSANIFNVNVAAKRNEMPKDFLSKMKMAYLEEGARPSHRWYGWVTT